MEIRRLMRKYVFCPNCEELKENFELNYKEIYIRSYSKEDYIDLEEYEETDTLPDYDEKELIPENEYTIPSPDEIVTTIFCPDCNGEIFEINNVPTYDIPIKDITISVDVKNKKVIVGKYYFTEYFKGDIEEFKKYLKEKFIPKGYEIISPNS